MPQRGRKPGALAAFALLLLLGGCQQSAVRAPSFDDPTVYTSADGRAYRLQRLEKKPGGYAWVSKTQLRYYPFGFYEVEREDKHYFYVRQYVPVKVMPPAAPAEAITPLAPAASTTFAWKPFDAGLPRTGQWRDQFDIADMDGDGWPDIVFGAARKGARRPQVFRGDGRGHWTPWTAASFAPLGYDYGGAAVADFDGDRRPDIALGMHLTGVAVLRGEGKGRYADASAGLPRRRGARAPQLGSRHVLAFDWNGDGRAALVVLNERIGLDPQDGLHDGVLVYRRDGEAWTALPSEEPLRGAAMMAKDEGGHIFGLLQPGGGTQAVRLSLRQDGRWDGGDVDGIASNAALTAFALVASKDGPRAAVAYRTPAENGWWTQLDLLERKDGRWRAQALLRRQGDAISALAFGHFRPGASADLVFADERGEAAVLRQDAQGGYTLDRSLPAPEWRTGCASFGLMTADLDRNGIDEVVLSFAGEPDPYTGTVLCQGGGAIQAFKLVSP